MKQRYIFNKTKLINDLQPRRMQDVWEKMELSVHQMITFWKVEPDVHRLLRLKEATELNPLEYVIPTGRRYKK